MLALVARLCIDFTFVVKVKHFLLFVMVRVLLFLLALLSSGFNYFFGKKQVSHITIVSLLDCQSFLSGCY